jgi:hypothetical protein
MKTPLKIWITTLICLFLSIEIISSQTVNLKADQIRIRYQNQSGDWTAWDTSTCNVPIMFSRELNICTIGNKLNETYSIIDRGPNNKWYESQDYEGRPLVIVLYKNIDSTYNVMVQYNNIYDKNGLLYPGYSYQYLHARIVKL